MHDSAICGIVRRKEVVLGARTAVDMTECYEEAGSLEVHVSIDVNPGIVANLYTAVGILLNGKLVELGYVIGRIVLGEPGDATT